MGSLKKQIPKFKKRKKGIYESPFMGGQFPCSVLSDDDFNQDPFFSIHIPIYKRKCYNLNYDFVVPILCYAYFQTLSNWELHLIDNSNGNLNLIQTLDQVEEVCGFQIDRTKINYYIFKNDILGQKRNCLIDMTTTPIIVNFDDDDIYLSQYLEHIHNFFQEVRNAHFICIGKRWQYAIHLKQALQCASNGAGYYVFRKELFDMYEELRYHVEKMTINEEKRIIQTIKNLELAWLDNQIVVVMKIILDCDMVVILQQMMVGNMINMLAQ